MEVTKSKAFYYYIIKEEHLTFVQCSSFILKHAFSAINTDMLAKMQFVLT